ncbi:MAG: formylglycine-generating enzyme family protein [Brachybacterium tyrofermentans]|uniref:formylglycine-generating enzyme family protein n=1 Tax=Brachybacterium tyrofermentans TaxID=47848 RepID=UPI000A1A58C7|nr:formylglycine-generating enzyme family protein [Brachybacterium tyrofermentans]SLN04183.1 Sulfatase modifying factor 1 precursor (C-alpha-formyglycine-generating enzyme 1) [Corynebacterium xerosis]
MNEIEHPAPATPTACCSAGRSAVEMPSAAPSHLGDPADQGPHPWAAPVAEVRGRADRAVAIPAGPFRMGSEDRDRNPGDGESPVRTVDVPAFRIDPTCVTNAEFAAFVDETGYVTEAEEFGWSFVFAPLLEKELRRASRKPPGTPWWRAVDGARWDQPEGPGSDVAERADHPVVHVSLRDAEAFATWCGMRLPREAEWEKAARGGLDQARFAWGDELTPGGEHRCNIWQGAFPVRNTLEDGYLATAPVRSFPPNGFGLYEVAGNVWEWCSDTWSTGDAPSLDGDVRVMRGGSYLCHDSYCNRYRVAARSSTAAEDASGNKGFRLAADA